MERIGGFVAIMTAVADENAAARSTQNETRT
jgi:hypothetical protein